jgi:diacylglycerol kinase family enzyme
MRVILVHNPAAGDAAHDRASLIRALETAGHEVEYVRSNGSSWEAALDSPADLIAVAGGDGTIGKVARRLGAGAPPVAVLPAGTANNIATGLGIMTQSVEALVARWPDARLQPFDIGLLRSRDRAFRFVESVGLGLLADAIAMIDGDQRLATQVARAEDPVAAAVEVYRRVLRDLEPVPVELRLDERDASGEYLLLEILTFGIAGPNLRLAPDARFADGLLDVVLIEAGQRDDLIECLPLYRTSPLSAPRLPTLRARTISLACRDRRMHVDDRLRPGCANEGSDRSADVSIEPGTVSFLI